MDNVSAALEEALDSRTAACWDRLDNLAASAVKRGFDNPDKLRRLLQIALSRLGYDANDLNSRSGRWIEDLLALILAALNKRDQDREDFLDIPLIMHSLDRNRRILCVTGGWLQHFKYERKESIIGRSIMEFLTPESQKSADHWWPIFWEDGIARGIGYTFVCGDGAHANIVLDGMGVFDEDGTMVRTISVIRHNVFQR